MDMMLSLLKSETEQRKSKTSNPADMSLGETVDYYPSGTYYLHCVKGEWNTDL